MYIDTELFDRIVNTAVDQLTEFKELDKDEVIGLILENVSGLETDEIEELHKKLKKTIERRLRNLGQV